LHSPTTLRGPGPHRSAILTKYSAFPKASTLDLSSSLSQVQQPEVRFKMSIRPGSGDLHLKS
jgi:hypothetical protein